MVLDLASMLMVQDLKGKENHSFDGQDGEILEDADGSYFDVGGAKSQSEE